VFIVLAKAMVAVDVPLPPKIAVPRHREAVVLALAGLSFLLGCVALLPLDVVQIGRPALLPGVLP
jgi:hypothetical protein